MLFGGRSAVSPHLARIRVGFLALVIHKILALYICQYRI